MVSKGESLVGGSRPQHQQLGDLLAAKLVPGRPKTLWGEAADAELAGHLACPLNTPLLVLRRISTAGDRPTEYVISRYRGDRYQVHRDLGRDAQSTAEPTQEGILL